jgi:hypothetical protein
MLIIEGVPRTIRLGGCCYSPWQLLLLAAGVVLNVGYTAPRLHETMPVDALRATVYRGNLSAMQRMLHVPQITGPTQTFMRHFSLVAAHRMQNNHKHN